MPDILTDPLSLWTLLVFIVGFGLGKAMDAILYLLTGQRPHPWLVPREPAEAELFTTTTPGRYPPGRVVTLAGGRHIITSVDDLGSFPDIDGQRHQQWRVYGRPA
jgi:hypothetical protein